MIPLLINLDMAVYPAGMLLTRPSYGGGGHKWKQEAEPGREGEHYGGRSNSGGMQKSSSAGLYNFS